MKEAGYVYTITMAGGRNGRGDRITPYTVGWSLISFTKLEIHSNILLTPMLFLKKSPQFVDIFDCIFSKKSFINFLGVRRVKELFFPFSC